MNDCIEWEGSRTSLGYGRVQRRIGGQVVWKAHRLAWIQTYGPIPDGMEICHTCDNPPCVNPDHLFLGTQADNMADMIAKGRHRHPDNRGSLNGRAKLTEDDVRAIRAARGKRTQRAIAYEYGITRQYVSRIQRGKAWKAETADE